jgi:hypothetical protein
LLSGAVRWISGAGNRLAGAEFENPSRSVHFPVQSIDFSALSGGFPMRNSDGRAWKNGTLVLSGDGLLGIFVHGAEYPGGCGILIHAVEPLAQAFIDRDSAPTFVDDLEAAIAAFDAVTANVGLF